MGWSAFGVTGISDIRRKEEEGENWSWFGHNVVLGLSDLCSVIFSSSSCCVLAVDSNAIVLQAICGGVN